MSAQNVISVRAANFEQFVIQRSHQVLVLVDFWAPWCGPCRMLGPVLDRVAAAYPKDLVVAKVNTDEEQELAHRYGIQGIPAVKVFKGGAVVSEFTGARGEAEVVALVRSLLPTQADALAEEGAALARDGHLNAAEERFRAALEADPRQARALLGLAEIAGQRGDWDQAEVFLLKVPPGSPLQAAADQALGLARLGKVAGEVMGEAEAVARLAAIPADKEARLALGIRYALRSEPERALEELLRVVQGGGVTRERAQAAMVAIFNALGPTHPLTRTFRGRLAVALY